MPPFIYWIYFDKVGQPERIYYDLEEDSFVRWLTRDGHHVLVQEMDDEHLLNTIAVLKGDSPVGTVVRFRSERHRKEWLTVMTAEAKRRKLGEFKVDILQQLRRLNTENSNLDELIALEVFAVQLQAGYQKHQVPSPDWLEQALKTLELEIVSKTRAALELKLREARANQANLRTREERRQLVDQQVEELELALGYKKEAPAQTTT
jgi:hypothetical protein